MKTYYVDFTGYCEIEAESSVEAEAKFWKLINKNKPLPQNIYDIGLIELKSE